MVLNLIKRLFRRRKKTVETRCPACPECGCATVPSMSDHTVVIGGEEEGNEGRTEPIVKATVVICLPVFQCQRPQCGTTMYGKEAEELMKRCLKSLQDNARKI